MEMDKTELNYNRVESKLEILIPGLNLEIQPYNFLKSIINENSQKILDEIIASNFRKYLKAFEKWEDDILQSIGDEDPDFAFVEHKHKKHIQQIQDVADFTRGLLQLHSDWEYVMTNEDKEIIDRAIQYWNYNSFYGFKN